MNYCDPNDPNYLECVARNYGGRDDYEQFAPKGYSSEGIGGFNFGDFFSSISEGIGSFQGISQQPSALNPLGLGTTARLGGLFGPPGLIAGLIVDKYRAGQEAKAAAEAKAAEEARARQEQINRNKQYFSGPSQTSGGGFDTSAADRAGTSLGSGQFSPSTSRGRSGY